MKYNTLSRFLVSKRGLGNSVFYLAGILLAVLYIYLQPGLGSLDQTQAITHAYDSKAASYLIAFLIMLLCALTPLPAELIALGNAFSFPPVEAFFVTWLSACLSASIGYEFGRLNGIDPCDNKYSNKICQWLNRYGYKALVIMRLIPVVPFFALNLCGGIFKLNRYKYIIITSITIIPAVALLTFFPQLFLQINN